MRILQILYYYEPYTSGLTIYAARLARALAARGHQVSVLASRHDAALSLDETAEGIRIRRLPVAATLDRAVIVPSLIPRAIAMMRNADVVHLHLPLAEAAILVLIGRLMGKRMVVTHHADLVLEGNRLSRIAARVARWSAIGGGKLAAAFVTNTASRAKVSPVAKHMSRNLHIIPPPIVVEPVTPTAGEDVRRDFRLGNGPLVGYVGRYASEKGIDVLLQTIPAVKARFPNAVYALAGPRFDPRDGSVLRGPWTPWLERYAATIRQLDYLSDADLARFYAACDVLVLPSVDWTESFGMVQVEAMLHGTPVVASDLPGVADPVTNTGYGLLAAPGDVADLETKMIEVLSHPDRYSPDPLIIHQLYSLDATVAAYERIYQGTAR